MSAMAMIPGSSEWLSVLFKPALELRVRRQLRVLEQAVDARCVVLWMPGGTMSVDEVITFAGDRNALPRRFEFLRTSVPSHCEMETDDGWEDAVVCGVRLGRALPTLGLAAISPRICLSAELLQAVGQAGEALEEIIVGALG
jgi:hypothetical protein